MIKWLEKRRKRAFLFTLLITIEIFWFSTLQLGGTPRGFSFMSIAYHFIVFFLFNFFLLALIKGEKQMTFLIVIIALFISINHAIFDEVHQMFIPLRDANIKDVMTDTAGILTSTLIYLFIDKKSTLPSKKEKDHLSYYAEGYEDENEEQPDQQLL